MNKTILFNQSVFIDSLTDAVLTMLRIIIILLVVSCGCYSEEELKAEARDSYIDAYHESHGSSGSIVVNKNDRESYYDGLEQFYGPTHPGYPEPSFSSSNYGPPVYGPPTNIPRYTAFPAPFYGVPHAMMGLLDKLHLKLDIYTILKIILKLVIFKKIISFIALICLLLFIPKFKMPKGEAEMDELDDSRSFKDEKSQDNARLNILTQYVLDSIEKYSSNGNITNSGVQSYAARVLNEIDNNFTYQRLVSMYVNENS